MAAVADHMGDQLGSIAYFDTYHAPTSACSASSPTTRSAWGIAAATTSTSRRSGRSAHTCHKHQAVNANVLAAQAILALDGLQVRTRHWSRGSSTCSAPRPSWCRAASTGSPAGRALDDPRRVRDPRRLPPAAGRDDRGRAGGDRPMPRAKPRRRTRASAPRSRSPTSSPATWPAPEDEVVRLMRAAVREVRGGEDAAARRRELARRHRELRSEGPDRDLRTGRAAGLLPRRAPLRR